MEARADADAALHADRATHQFDQFLADGQAQARAAVAARGGMIGLLEFLEQTGQGVGVDAGTRIADDEFDGAAAIVARRRAGAPHFQQHFAIGREFQRVPQQVDEDLPQARGVRAHVARQVQRQFAAQQQAFRIGLALHDAGRVADQRQQVEVHGFQGQLARVDLREIEDVVEDGQQRHAIVQADAQIFLRTATYRLVAQGEFQHADDPGQRRADVVAHGGQKIDAVAADHFRVFLGLQQGVVAEGERQGALLHALFQVVAQQADLVGQGKGQQQAVEGAAEQGHQLGVGHHGGHQAQVGRQDQKAGQHQGDEGQHEEARRLVAAAPDDDAADERQQHPDADDDGGQGMGIRQGEEAAGQEQQGQHQVDLADPVEPGRVVAQAQEMRVEQGAEDGQQEKRHVMQLQHVPVEQVGKDVEGHGPGQAIGQHVQRVIGRGFFQGDGKDEEIEQAQRQQGADRCHHQEVFLAHQLAVILLRLHAEHGRARIVGAGKADQDVICGARRQLHVPAVVQQIFVRPLVARQQGLRRRVWPGAIYVQIDQVDQGIVRVDDPGRYAAVVAHLRMQPVGAAEQVDLFGRALARQPGGQGGRIGRGGLTSGEKQLPTVAQVLDALFVQGQRCRLRRTRQAQQADQQAEQKRPAA
ncbi:hypothetical protein JANLI_26310 [Janthinobacterium lividum]|nr:hypothetical protein JANLI_26310 [Janthinobacterium lividum]